MYTVSLHLFSGLADAMSCYEGSSDFKYEKECEVFTKSCITTIPCRLGSKERETKLERDTQLKIDRSMCPETLVP